MMQKISIVDVWQGFRYASKKHGQVYRKFLNIEKVYKNYCKIPSVKLEFSEGKSNFHLFITCPFQKITPLL